ncbi:MAG: PP2C family protein-serine/threonine phosphatase, partial [Flammeovirgaceae bacterium]
KNERLAQQQEELLTKSEEIHKQNELLETTNRKITDSINYAKRIQEALIKDNKRNISSASDYFQIYLPRDIVSGDFLWYYKDNGRDQLFVANVDCTGHGVPGALISIIGISALQEIIIDKRIEKPDEILHLLDYKIKHLLRQNEEEVGIRDGMDIGLCVINYDKMEALFAGAHTPMVYVSNGDLQVIKGNRFAIGGYRNKTRQQEFECHQVKIKPKDRIYLYSDGIIDQFGGENGNSEKFKTRRLLSKIQEIQHESMTKQGELLLNVFERWKGEHRQIDDVSMVGVEI